jgi:hypothetical protein
LLAWLVALPLIDKRTVVYSGCYRSLIVSCVEFGV